MLKVYYADVSALDLERDYPLSDYRAEKMKKLTSPEKKRLSLGSELLLIHALTREMPYIPLPLDIKTDECGKPFIADWDIFFSLSHSGVYAACALAHCNVGIDIQEPVTYNENVANRLFTGDEREYIAHSHDKDRAFGQIWCEKESRIKAFGGSLIRDGKKFSVLKERDIRYTSVDGYHIGLCLPDCENIVPDNFEKINLPG